MKDSIIQSAFIPKLEALGFAHTPLDAEDKKSPEIKSAFPFGRFIKKTGAVNYLVEIQFDKYNKEKFRINLGTFPETGITHPHAGHLAAEAIWTGYLPSHYVMYKFPFFRIWFQTSEKLNFENLACEIRDFISHQKVGGHMRRVDAWKAAP